MVLVFWCFGDCGFGYLLLGCLVDLLMLLDGCLFVVSISFFVVMLLADCVWGC